MPMLNAFNRLASGITRVVGTPWALLLAFGVVLTWAMTGPMFEFSDTWQLAINTGTTIVTFLMVFVIQATQNREAKVTQLKLDELIRAVEGARNGLIALEESSEERVEAHAEEFRAFAASVQPDLHLERLVPEKPAEESARRTARSTRAAGGSKPASRSAARSTRSATPKSASTTTATRAATAPGRKQTTRVRTATKAAATPAAAGRRAAAP